MYLRFIIGLFPVLAIAAPLVEDSNPSHEVAEPFAERSIFPGQAALSGWSIFRRQGCPNLSLLCPSGLCCSYATEVPDCCGKNCCATEYLCTGGTASNPCCVAITDTTNTCGSVNKNPCITPGYLPCSGANFCCPPDSLCYVDSFNVARCSPKGTIPSTTPSPKPSPTPTPISSPKSSSSPTPTPSPSPSTTITTTKSSSRSTTSSTTSSLQPTPTPVSFNSGSGSDSGSGSGSSSSYSREGHGFWTPAAIGGVAGGGAGAFILIFLLFCCCVRKKFGKSNGNGGGGGGGGGGSGIYGWTSPRTPPSIQPLSDRQIAALVKYRDTTQDWQNFYIKEGRRIEGQSHIDRATWLGDFAARAIQQRHYQLRNGGGQLLAHLICGAVGWIPGAKLLIGPGAPWNLLAISKAGHATNLEELFNKLEKKAKEMGEPMWLVKKTAKKIAKDKDVQAEVLNELNTYLTNEFGSEAAAVAMEDTIHFIPLIGHAYGAYKGIDRSNTRINKALDFLKDEALDFHLSVFVMNVL